MGNTIQKCYAGNIWRVSLGVADDPFRPDSTAQYLKIAHAVPLHGAIAHHELPDYYNGADVCVITSYHKSQSMVVLEASACAVLTVSTGVGILPELVDSAFIIPPPTAPEIGDSDKLATILRRLADDKLLRVSESASLHSDATTHSPRVRRYGARFIGAWWLMSDEYMLYYIQKW